MALDVLKKQQINIRVPIGDKAIVLEVCERCLQNFVEDKVKIRDHNIQTNTNTGQKNKNM